MTTNYKTGDHAIWQRDQERITVEVIAVSELEPGQVFIRFTNGQRVVWARELEPVDAS